MKLAPSRTDLLALITLNAARLCKAGQSCSNISLVDDLDFSLDLLGEVLLEVLVKSEGKQQYRRRRKCDRCIKEMAGQCYENIAKNPMQRSITFHH